MHNKNEVNYAYNYSTNCHRLIKNIAAVHKVNCIDVLKFQDNLFSFNYFVLYEVAMK